MRTTEGELAFQFEKVLSPDSTEIDGNINIIKDSKDKQTHEISVNMAVSAKNDAITFLNSQEKKS